MPKHKHKRVIWSYTYICFQCKNMSAFGIQKTSLSIWASQFLIQSVWILHRLCSWLSERAFSFPQLLPLCMQASHIQIWMSRVKIRNVWILHRLWSRLSKTAFSSQTEKKHSLGSFSFTFGELDSLESFVASKQAWNTILSLFFRRQGNLVGQASLLTRIFGGQKNQYLSTLFSERRNLQD